LSGKTERASGDAAAARVECDMMFFDAKRVFLIVGAIVGILVVVIAGFLYTGGVFSFDSGDSLYQGFLDERYLTTSAISVKGSPVDENTLEILNDTDNIKVIPDSGGGDGDADGPDDSSGGGADAAPDQENIQVRVLLFLKSEKLVASGFAFADNNKFSLTKSFDMMNIGNAVELPHMSRDRDILTYNDVDAILDKGGYFRIVADTRYITGRIVPGVSVLIN
jgi:hypothetical protein